MTGVSVVLPTYNERSTILDVIAGIQHELDEYEEKYEVVVVDDDSPDGTAQLVRESCGPRVRVIKRTGVSGLSSAIHEGLQAATCTTIVCMDADGQHPPSVVPRLVDEIQTGCDVAVGSRHVAGGRIAASWGVRRHLTSWGASGLAWLTIPAARTLRDPMSGCFAINTTTTHGVLDDVDPHGYKILLDIIGRLPDPTVREVGMEFHARAGGESKLDSSEIGRYAEHLAGLGLHQLGLHNHLTPTIAVRAIEAGIVTGLCAIVVLFSMLIAGALGYALTAAAGGAMTLMFVRVWRTADTWSETTNPPPTHVEELGGSQQ